MRTGAIYEWDFTVKKSADDFRKQILELCCEEFNCTLEEVRGSSRERHLTNARLVFSTICRKHFNDTLMHIAIELNKKHESIMYLLRKMEDYEYTKDPVVKRMQLIERKILKQ